MNKYIVVTNLTKDKYGSTVYGDHEDLVSSVNEEILKGYRPIGGVSVSFDRGFEYYAQAMIYDSNLI